MVRSWEFEVLGIWKVTKSCSPRPRARRRSSRFHDLEVFWQYWHCLYSESFLSVLALTVLGKRSRCSVFLPLKRGRAVLERLASIPRHFSTSTKSQGSPNTKYYYVLQLGQCIRVWPLGCTGESSRQRVRSGSGGSPRLRGQAGEESLL